MKVPGITWTSTKVMGVVALVAAAIAVVIVLVRDQQHVEREVVFEMTVEGCLSPDVYPPQFTGANLLKRVGRDTWFIKDDNFIVYKSLPVFISEFLATNSNLEDDDGEPSDWIELHNREKISVNLEGWSLTDTAKKPQKWVFPRYMLKPDQYLIVYASGKDRVSGRYVHTNFRLSRKGGYIALIRPDGSVATALDKKYPPQMPNVAYGIPQYPSTSTEFTYLNKPTAGSPNAGVLNKGPFISKVELLSGTDMPPPGEDLVIDAVISPYAAVPECVSLVYTVMYGNEKHIPMTRNGTSGFTARIPADEFFAGNMVRWYVKASDKKGRTARDPPFLNADRPEYHGAVIFDASLNSTLPSLYWFTNSPVEAVGNGARGSLFFKGKFYDNLFTRRRGATALTWRKPKIKFDFKGSVFEYKKNRFVEEFNLQSFFLEKGENSYMREPVALQIMREAGVPASEAMHMTVNQNGEYYGLFAFIEQMDDNFLVENGYSTEGPLFKAIDWMNSNLRYDIPESELKNYYRKANRKDTDDWHLLYNLALSLSGGGSLQRSKFIFDRLNLPQIINNMALNTMFLNQDRCTKNYYIYLNPEDSRWTIFPWDMDGAFGLSHGLGGQPVKDYCLLACEQFNSPLFCDSEHPQDIDIPQTGRKMLFSRVSETPTYRISSREEYNKDQTGNPSLGGAVGHYNYLYDALLDWPVTREMYLRRLRTLTDKWTNGRIQDMFTEQWSKIRSEALRDNDKWKVTSNPDNGLKQLLTEQIPTRKAQLLDTYGPQGFGLVPSAQPAAPTMKFKNSTGDYLEIENPNPFAVDMSNWLVGGDTYFKFPPGTVVASRNSVFVTPDIKAFYRRKTSPMAGERLLVLGPSLPIKGKSFILQTDESVQI